jgi:DNA-directed RNA polymerase specialized sigma24 family protein
VNDLGALYRQYAPDVFRFALHLCRDRHQAEDLTSRPSCA